MAQFRKHANRFRDLCNGWGIGDETFEFWSWMAKQYTMLADLIDLACRHGMRLPTLLPSQILAKPSSSALDAAQHEIIILGNVLVHPGFYYYQSGVCTIERREKFRASQAAEVSVPKKKRGGQGVDRRVLI